MDIIILIVQLSTIGYIRYRLKAVDSAIAHLEANVDVTRARLMQHVTAFLNVVKKAINLK